ncbi:serine--tRNA ligase [Candidatus Falkowbacteria bacterium]|nr:serine--tRNA ligase [Candidatus Falkowbacteria bacterium]
MLDLKYIRENINEVKENCHYRLVNVDIDHLVELDEQRRRLQQALDEQRSRRNAWSKQKPNEEQIIEIKANNEAIKQGEEQLVKIIEELDALLLAVPNQTDVAVVRSLNEDDNPVLEEHGQPLKFTFEPKDHLALAEQWNWLDFERAAKVAGAKFYYTSNDLVWLELALIQYALATIAKHGFQVMTTPDLAKTSIIERLGYNPRGESTQIYNLDGQDLSLIGTAEITLGGYHQDEVLSGERLPLRYVALSQCFRTEAGSYSKFAKGIFRVHQFNKVEMFVYCRPEDSVKEHQLFLEIEKEIFSGLEIPFRVIDHCTADLGAPSTRTFDVEAWLPGKPNKENQLGDWAEMTSASNCTDYQARGLDIKYQATDGQKGLAHTLNGTGLALPRAMIAILENHQQADGRIKLPIILKPFIPLELSSMFFI